MIRFRQFVAFLIVCGYGSEIGSSRSWRGDDRELTLPGRHVINE